MMERQSRDWRSQEEKAAGLRGLRPALQVGVGGAVMDFSSQREWIHALWVLFGVYWLVSAFKRKKTKQRESWGQRLRYVLPLVVAFYLLSRPLAHYGWLGARFVPASDAAGWVGVVLTAAGVAIAFWARWHLGANWSGVVTLKEGHEFDLHGNFAGAAGQRGQSRRSARPAGLSHRLAFLLYKSAPRRISPHTGIRPRLRGTPPPDRNVSAPLLLAGILASARTPIPDHASMSGYGVNQEPDTG